MLLLLWSRVGWIGDVRVYNLLVCTPFVGRAHHRAGLRGLVIYTKALTLLEAKN